MEYCLYCGKEIKKKSRDKHRPRKFCDLTCYKLYRGCKTYSYSTCQYCGKKFKETRDRPNKYCSKSCSNKANGLLRTKKKLNEKEHKDKLFNEYQETLKHLEDLRYRIEHEKICKMCNKPFIAINSNQVCCSKECSKKNENRTKDKRIYKNGEPDLSINLTRLYLRDEGICQICGKHIDFDCDSNSNHYPSIDHIVPLSKGGLHQWDNVQLACRICNTYKSNKLISPPLE